MRAPVLVAPLLVAALVGCSGGTDTAVAEPTRSVSVTLAPSPSPSAPASTTAAPTTVPPTLSPSPAETPTVSQPSPSPSLSPDPSESATPIQPPSVTSAPSSSSAPPAPATTASAEAPGSGWQPLEVDVASAADVPALAGAPAGFADYVTARFGGPDADGCSLTHLSVISVHADGFVYGSEAGDCGGGASLYSGGAGGWKLAVVMQGMPLCEQLTDAGVPAGLGILCGDGATQRDY